MLDDIMTQLMVIRSLVKTIRSPEVQQTSVDGNLKVQSLLHLLYSYTCSKMYGIDPLTSGRVSSSSGGRGEIPLQTAKLPPPTKEFEHHTI